MFKDLREYAENEEALKQELSECKARRGEAEQAIEEMREKAHGQEVRVRTMQVEMEKIRREAQMKSESQRFVEKDLETLRQENEQLRERLMERETERANMINEKERKERECKHLQNEVNRINQMV